MNAGIFLNSEAEKKVRDGEYAQALNLLLAKNYISALNPYSAIHQYPSEMKNVTAASYTVHYAYGFDENDHVTMVISYHKRHPGKDVFRIEEYYPDGNLKKDIRFDSNQSKELYCSEYYDRKRIGVLTEDTAGPNGIPPLQDIRSVEDLFPPQLTGIKYCRRSGYAADEEFFFDENGILTDYHTSAERPLFSKTADNDVTVITCGGGILRYEYHYGMTGQYLLFSGSSSGQKEYTYDENGRLSSAGNIMMRFNENDDLEWAKEDTDEAWLHYNEDHLLQKIEYSRGDQVLFEYNDDNHISLITHNQSSGGDRAWKYLYDQKGRLKEKVYVYGEQESTEFVYSYY